MSPRNQRSRGSSPKRLRTSYCFSSSREKTTTLRGSWLSRTSRRKALPKDPVPPVTRMEAPFRSDMQISFVGWEEAPPEAHQGLRVPLWHGDLYTMCRCDPGSNGVFAPPGEGAPAARRTPRPGVDGPRRTRRGGARRGGGGDLHRSR